MKPPLCVCLLTYDRFEYARMTLESVLQNLTYDGPVGLHIADDGSPGDYVRNLSDIAHALSLKADVATWLGVTTSNAEREGYGRNYNLATQAFHPWAKYALMLEDDWECARALDLDHLVTLLEHFTGDIGCLRLGYLAWTAEMRGMLDYHEKSGEHLLVLDYKSPEKHVFAGHPRLDSVAWQRTVGPWPERLSPGETELAVCAIPASRRGVAWPLDEVRPRGDLFHHIGTRRSY